jgi:hypothetical protein
MILIRNFKFYFVAMNPFGIVFSKNTMGKRIAPQRVHTDCLSLTSGMSTFGATKTTVEKQSSPHPPKCARYSRPRAQLFQRYSIWRHIPSHGMTMA